MVVCESEKEDLQFSMFPVASICTCQHKTINDNCILCNYPLSHRKKRMRQLQKKIKSGKVDIKEDDPFELFISATSIRYCYYAETHKILGSTYGMCVLQVM